MTGRQIMKKIAIEDSICTIGRIIVVDDEAELLSALCETLVGQGYETAGFLTGSEALAVLREREFDLLLTDLMMPGMDGIGLIRAGLEIDPNLIGIIMTGHGTVQTAVEAMKTGAFDYMLKPFKLNTLLPLLSRAMQVRNLRLENMQLKETVAIHELGKAISFSSDLNSILNKIADAALQQCNADEVSIMLPTKGGRELYVAVVRGGHTESLGEHAPIERGIAGWVACNRESVVLKGEVNDPRMAPIRPRNDIHTAISMPMLSQGKLVGVLNVNITKSHRQFTLGQLKALSILVSIIAPILENAALYIQIRRAEEEYRSIFENAIEGIFRQTSDGRLISVNPAFARTFGYDSPEDITANLTDFIHQVYVDPDRGVEFARLMYTEGEVRKFEFQARRKDGSQAWISVNGHVVRDEKGGLLYYEGMTEDITESKLSEVRLNLAKEILETLNHTNDIKTLINDILRLLKEHTGFEAIGIRLKEGEDYPYFVAIGFLAHFLEAENHLCARDAAGEIIRDSEGNPYLEGKCGDVLCGLTDPSKPFFTEGGSFWTNSTTKRLAETSTNEPQARIRNRCNSEGYESLALIPLRSGGEIIGLLQLSDSRPNLFTPDMIHFLEGIAASIGIAVARRQSLEALRTSEERYRLHFENVTDVIFSIDPDLKLLSISPSVENVLGYRPEELIGKPIHQLQVLAADQLEQPDSDLRFVLADNRVLSKVYELIAKDGTRRFCEISAASLLHYGRTAAICVARDITERKQAEEWLLRERNMVDRIMRTSPAGIIVANRDGRIIFANKRAGEIYGLGADEMTRRAYNSPEWLITDFNGNPFPMEKLPLAMVISSGSPVYGIRHAIHSPEDRRVYLSINGAPIHDEKGNINEVVLTIDDVTDSEHAEEALREITGRLHLAMASVKAGVWDWNLQTSEMIWDDRMFELYGLTHENFPGGIEAWKQGLHPDDSSKAIEEYQAALRGERDFDTEFRVRRPDGTVVHIKTNGVVLRDKEGKPLRMIGLNTDITERKKAEESLKETLERLSKAVNATVQVMVSASEIRDPYTAGHQSRSADLARAIATEMGLPQEKIDGIRMACSIHDIGKLSIPAEILSKPTKLSEIEFSLIKEHARRGFEMLTDVESPWTLAAIVHQHHERMDGSGYPRNLKKDDILIEARILAVADVVEAMASHRPYRPALGLNAALDEIEKNRGTLYDKTVADTCLRLFREKGFQFAGT